MKFRADTVDLMRQASKLFGKILNQLMVASQLSQHQLSKDVTARRDALIGQGKIPRGKSLIGGMTQETISNVIAGQCPTYCQVGIWLDVIRDWYQSQEMLNKVASAGLPEPQPFTSELEADMWRLALFGTGDEIEAAYERCKDLDLLADRPVVSSYRMMNLQTSKSEGRP